MRIPKGISLDYAKKSALLFGATISGSLIVFLSNYILSRDFGPELFGNYKTIVSLLLFFLSILELGAPTTLTKFISERQDRNTYPLIRWFLRLRAGLYLILIVVMITFRDQISLFIFKDASFGYLFLPGALFCIFAFFDIFKAITLGFLDFNRFSASQFLTSFFIGVLTLIFGYFFGAFYAIIGYGLGFFLGNLGNLRLFLIKRKSMIEEGPIRERIIQNGMIREEMTQEEMTPGARAPDLDEIAIFKSYSLPVYLMAIPGNLGNAMIPGLSLIYSQEMIGLYSFSWVFYSSVLLISDALSQILFPKISQLSNEADHKSARAALRSAFLLYTPIVIIGTIGCISLSDLFLNSFAPEYLRGQIIFETLIFFGLLSGYLSIYRSYLTGLARIKEAIIVVMINNILLFIFSIIAMQLAPA